MHAVLPDTVIEMLADCTLCSIGGSCCSKWLDEIYLWRVEDGLSSP